MDRKPRGYVGRNHETIGSDILSIFGLLFPEMALGQETAAKLKAVAPDQWYPISMLLEPMELIAKKIGDGGLRAMGMKLFQLSHEDHVRKVARTAADIIYSLDALYHRANRGEELGGWKVLRFEPGLALLDKTTPHHCKMEEGILSQALMSVGVPARVTQTQCFRQGADSCLFQLTSSINDARWGTAR